MKAQRPLTDSEMAAVFAWAEANCDTAIGETYLSICGAIGSTDTWEIIKLFAREELASYEEDLESLGHDLILIRDRLGMAIIALMKFDHRLPP